MATYGRAGSTGAGSIRIAVLAATAALFLWAATPRGTLGWLIRAPITLATSFVGGPLVAAVPALVLPLGSPFADVTADETIGIAAPMDAAPNTSFQSVRPAPAAPAGPRPGNPQPPVETPLPLPESPVPLPESPVPLPETPGLLPESPVPLPGAPEAPQVPDAPGNNPAEGIPGLPDVPDAPGIPGLPDL